MERNTIINGVGNHVETQCIASLRKPRWKYMRKLIAVMLSVLILLIWPVILWHKEISFDKILFINTWIELIGSGIIIAFMLYLMTLLYDKFVEKNIEQKTICEMMRILENIKANVENKDNSKLADIEIDIEILSSLSKSINDPAKRTKAIIINATQGAPIKNKINQVRLTATNDEIINKINVMLNKLKELL
ncbi:MAG: hypothetical protein LBR10_01395 [Prevotellaceae bacterium]|nr:hypothetical protein [Prevotellaceae bacterium]